MTKSSKSFVARVLDKLTGGDEAKISRFQAKTVKVLKGQVSVRKNEVEDLEEKINDLQEKYEDTLVAVDLEAIKSSDGLENYVQKYIVGLQKVKDEIVAVDKKIKSTKEEIAKFEGLISDLA